MSILFVGDISYPKIIKQDLPFLKQSLLIGNLEGPIINPSDSRFVVRDQFKYNLFCIEAVVEFLKTYNFKCISLANNHIFDFKQGFKNTINILIKNNIDFFGINEKPYLTFEEDNIEYFILGTVTHLTEPNTNKVFVFNSSKILNFIAKIRESNSCAKIIVYVHWGYELSYFPQPADRSWARKAISMGANIIIGHHPHVVQGIEIFKNSIIAYSLGNFYLPQTYYLDKKLSYKDSRVCEELAIRITPSLIENSIIYWLEYNAENDAITLQKSEKLNKSSKIKHLTPYSGFSDLEYRLWFKKQNKSNRGTPKKYPTFYSYSNIGSYYIKIWYLKLIKLVRKVAIIFGLHKPW